MSDISLDVENAVEPRAWDELAARMGGGYFHCHAHAVHTARRGGGKALFVRALGGDRQCVGIAAATVAAWGESYEAKATEKTPSCRNASSILAKTAWTLSASAAAGSEANSARLQYRENGQSRGFETVPAATPTHWPPAFIALTNSGLARLRAALYMALAWQ